MSDVIQMLKSIGDFLVSIGKFVVDFVWDLVYIVKITGDVFSDLPQFLSWLPSTFVSALLVILGIAVVYKISGRE